MIEIFMAILSVEIFVLCTCMCLYAVNCEKEIPNKKCIILTTISLLMLVGTIIGAQLNVSMLIEPKFNAEVDGYLIRAVNSADPFVIRENLVRCEQGMHNLGLTSSDSAYFWSWEKIKPDGLMSWQFQMINSTIERCDEFIDWLALQNQSTQQWQDVYTQKLNNLKSFIGTSLDNIAWGAYIVKYHDFYRLQYQLIIIATSTSVILSFIGIFLFAKADEEEKGKQ